MKVVGDRDAREKKIKTDKIEGQYYNRTRHHSQNYNERPVITGDYFKSSWETMDDSSHYCQYANSTTCANCARRKEHKKNDLYFYGVSDKCKEYYNS